MWFRFSDLRNTCYSEDVFSWCPWIIDTYQCRWRISIDHKALFAELHTLGLFWLPPNHPLGPTFVCGWREFMWTRYEDWPSMCALNPLRLWIYFSVYLKFTSRWIYFTVHVMLYNPGYWFCELLSTSDYAGSRPLSPFPVSSTERTSLTRFPTWLMGHVGHLCGPSMCGRV